jgi:hypothetical protein
MKTAKIQRLFLIGIVTLLILMGFIGIFLPFIPPGNADINTTSELNTSVNITNSAPDVQGIVVDTPITLNAMANVTITCNATVFDWDDNFNIVNATFYAGDGTSSAASDSGNNHYRNSSCVNISEQPLAKNYTCTFKINYYANNGTWYCNVTAYDTFNATGSNRSEPVRINSLVAIYIPSGILDFGSLAAGNISTEDALANITNVGNRNLTLNVSGYAINRYDGYAMNCTNGNILVNNQRYNISANVNWTYASALTNNSARIQNLVVSHRTNDDTESKNSTYWRIRIPNGAAGKCTGSLLFEATDSGS